jgi:hypothetical protein
VKFLSGRELTVAIKKLLKEPRMRCAVAFWGNDCDKWLKSKSARVICNLSAGGTNPHALKKLQLPSKNLKQYDLLHAKVFIGKKHSIVASANVSSNGLGFEGIEQKGWHEAGVQIDTSEDLTTWFEKLWTGSARSITSNDWKEAKRKWKLRQQAKPTLPNFGSFDVNQNNLPFLDWYGPFEWESIKENIVKQYGWFDDKVEELIDNGVEIVEPRDRKLLKDRWALRWEANKDGIQKSKKLYFVKMSDKFIAKAYRYTGEKTEYDVLLGEEKQPPMPFDPKEENFISAFSKVLLLEKYKVIRGNDQKGSYYQSCRDLVKPFWKDLKEEYERLASTAQNRTKKLR